MRNPQWQKLATLKLDISKRCWWLSLSLSRRVNLLRLEASDVGFISRGWEGWMQCRVVMTYCVPFTGPANSNSHVRRCRSLQMRRVLGIRGKLWKSNYHLPTRANILQSQISMNCSTQFSTMDNTHITCSYSRGNAVTFDFLKAFTCFNNVILSKN